MGSSDTDAEVAALERQVAEAEQAGRMDLAATARRSLRQLLTELQARDEVAAVPPLVLDDRSVVIEEAPDAGSIEAKTTSPSQPAPAFGPDEPFVPWVRGEGAVEEPSSGTPMTSDTMSADPRIRPGIFISYDSNVRDWVDGEIVQLLKPLNVDYYEYREKGRVGADIPTELADAILTLPTFAMVVSTGVFMRRNVLNEWDYAINHGKQELLVLYKDEVPKTDIPLNYSWLPNIRGIRFSGNADAGRRELLKYIGEQWLVVAEGLAQKRA